MSVIPWILEGPSPTVTTNPSEFHIDGSYVYIKDCDSGQFKHKQFGMDENGRYKPNGSYDLHVGSQYRDHRRQSAVDVNNKNPIKLPPRSAATILVSEEVAFPTSVFGLIVPREKLLQKNGLEVPPTKVDPGYAGHLCVTVFNHGYKPIQIDYGEQFCALVLFQVSPKAYPRTQPSALLQGKDVGVSTGRRIGTFFRTQWQWLITSALAIAAIIAAFVR